MNGASPADGAQTVEFIQFDLPPLQPTEYTVTVTESGMPGDGTPGSPTSFSSSIQFAVAGERFTLAGGEVVSVFPPDLATGEFTGVLPQVVLGKPSLPWLRPAVDGVAAAPWLAVLLLNDDEMPTTGAGKTGVQPLKVKDLVPTGKSFTGPLGVSGTGTMPAGYLSYTELYENEQGVIIQGLDYGETPDDPCAAIDLPLELFNRIAPCAADLPYLAEVRETDTQHAEDQTTGITRVAVVVGNRLPKDGADAHAFLVSLEGFGRFLPGPDGTASPSIPSTPVPTTTVRLAVLYSWRFFADTGALELASLLTSLNRDPAGDPKGAQTTTTLQLPASLTPPDPAAVDLARTHASNGTLTPADTGVLAQNANAMGYVPLAHELRHAGTTVSWYRGPLVPYLSSNQVAVPATVADALARYDPQMGMFDVSYAAAWQLGQLLALQNRSIAVAIYQWRHAVKRARSAARDQRAMEATLGGRGAFESIVGRRARNVEALDTDMPDAVVKWLGRLQLLHGVPFQYLVPDERMLPVESLRVFYLDHAWVNALADGALSIGRFDAPDLAIDREYHHATHAAARVAARTVRPNPRVNAVVTDANGWIADGPISGFLVRSKAIAGWKRLLVHGYSDLGRTNEIDKLRLTRAAADTLLCILDGDVASIAINEAPEALHSGVEGSSPNFTTTLRSLTGSTYGAQLFDGNTELVSDLLVPRADGQTMNVAAWATTARTSLDKIPGQSAPTFTSVEYAVEFVKGVVKVVYPKGPLT